MNTSLKAGLPEIHFAWQAGEPTMLGVDYLRKIVDLQAKCAPADSKITNSFETNGMLLDDDWGAFLHGNEFLIGISTDGPKKVHEPCRIDHQGQPTFDKVMRGLEIPQRHEVEHNSLTTVHRVNGGKGKKVYRLLEGLDIDFMQFIPLVERNGADGLTGVPRVDMDPSNSVTEWSVSPRAYGKFLCDVFDTWLRNDIGEVFVQHFDVMLGNWVSGLCVFAETCGDSLALEHDGSLISCDHYVYPESSIGRITETPMRDMLWTERFKQAKATSLTEQCKACDYRFACNGGCPRHRIAKARNGEPRHHYFCES